MCEGGGTVGGAWRLAWRTGRRSGSGSGWGYHLEIMERKILVRPQIRDTNQELQSQLPGRRLEGLSQKVETLTGWGTFVLKAQLS